MADAGMRVSEVLHLRFSDLNFKEQLITVNSLKKRDKKEVRIIPMSYRVYNCFTDFLKNHKNIGPENYLFANSRGKPLTRAGVWKFLNQRRRNLNIPQLHPHALRHTFATQHLANGTSLAEIKIMLGHKKYDTTLIYASIPTQTLKERINTVSNPSGFWHKIKSYFFRKKPETIINIDFTNEFFTVGRNDILKQLENNVSKGVNTVIIGDIGTGKTHLLKALKIENRTLYLDDTESIKRQLASILLYFYKSEETVLSVLWKNFTEDEVHKKINRETTMNLCDEIIKCANNKNYVLIIDNITNITASARKIIEKLKDTFIIIAGARQIKNNDTSFLWNFEIVRLSNLDRSSSLQLISRLASSLPTESREILLNHIYEQTNGNPRAITELVERYRKEPFLDLATIRNTQHTGALKKFDFTFIIVILLVGLMSLRFFYRETHIPSMRVLGIIGLILLIFWRSFSSFIKKKFF